MESMDPDPAAYLVLLIMKVIASDTKLYWVGVGLVSNCALFESVTIQLNRSRTLDKVVVKRLLHVVSALLNLC